MNIEVHNQKVEKIIDDDSKLIKKIGIELAKKVRLRINQMKASPNFKAYLDYGLGKPHPLTGDLDDLYGIFLNKNIRLVVEPLVEKRDDESLIICESVNIKGVVEYHGDKKEWLIP